MILDVLANKWRAFKEAMKRILNYYLEYSRSEYLLWDPSSKGLIIYQYLLEELEAGV